MAEQQRKRKTNKRCRRQLHGGEPMSPRQLLLMVTAGVKAWVPVDLRRHRRLLLLLLVLLEEVVVVLLLDLVTRLCTLLRLKRATTERSSSTWIPSPATSSTSHLYQRLQHGRR